MKVYHTRDDILRIPTAPGMIFELNLFIGLVLVFQGRVGGPDEDNDDVLTRTDFLGIWPAVPRRIG